MVALSVLVVVTGLCWVGVCVARWRRHRHYVSQSTLQAHVLRSTKVGWLDGPVWKTPAEIQGERAKPLRSGNPSPPHPREGQ